MKTEQWIGYFWFILGSTLIPENETILITENKPTETVIVWETIQFNVLKKWEDIQSLHKQDRRTHETFLEEQHNLNNRGTCADVISKEGRKVT